MSTKGRVDENYLFRTYEASIKVIKGEMTEDCFFNIYFKDNEGYFSNPLLRFKPKELFLFLKKLGLKNRREFLTKSTGSIRQVSRLLEYKGHSLLQRYLMMSDKPLPREFIALIAILLRVPVGWILNDDICNKWETYHFYHLSNSWVDIDGFVYILSKVTTSEMWVRGMIIRGIDSGHIFLRVEANKGNFLIEVFNDDGHPSNVHCLFASLRNNFSCFEGLMLTAVEKQKNPAIVCNRDNQCFCLPVGFVSIESVL